MEKEGAREAGASGKSGRGRGRGKNAPRAEGIGDAIAMPFANINFSELIKAAISLFPLPSSLSIYHRLSRIHENDDSDEIDVATSLPFSSSG